MTHSFRGRMYGSEGSQSIDGIFESDGRSVWFSGDTSSKWSMENARISDRLGRTPRWIYLSGGVSIESLDNDAIDKVREASIEFSEISPSSDGGSKGQSFFGSFGGAGLMHTLESNWSAVVALGIGIVVVYFLLFKVVLPAASHSIAKVTPDIVSDQIGLQTEMAMDRLSVFSPSKLEESVQDHIYSEFERFKTNWPELQLELKIVSGSSGVGANAFALPNGVIYLTDQLVELADHENEVFGVLGHEVGHIYHRHSLQLLIEGSALALMVGVWLGDPGILGIPLMVLNNSYSRGYELEADQFAKKHAHHGGYRPEDLASMLQKLEQQNSTEDVPEFLSTHPHTKERVKVILGDSSL